MVLKFESCAVAILRWSSGRIEDCRAGMAGSNLPCHIGSIFFLYNSRDLQFDNIC